MFSDPKFIIINFFPICEVSLEIRTGKTKGYKTEKAYCIKQNSEITTVIMKNAVKTISDKHMSWDVCNLSKKITAVSSFMPGFAKLNLKHRER